MCTGFELGLVDGPHHPRPSCSSVSPTVPASILNNHPGHTQVLGSSYSLTMGSSTLASSVRRTPTCLSSSFSPSSPSSSADVLIFHSNAYPATQTCAQNFVFVLAVAMRRTCPTIFVLRLVEMLAVGSVRSETPKIGQPTLARPSAPP